jgi:hypothetical protein
MADHHEDNQPLALRFIKLITKGYTPAKDSWHAVKAQFWRMEHAAHEKENVIAPVYNVFGKAGTTGEEALAKLRSGMEKAGLYWIYKKMYAPVESAIKYTFAKKQAKAAKLEAEHKALMKKKGLVF